MFVEQFYSKTKNWRENDGRGEMMELNNVMVDGETFSLNTDRQTKKAKRRKTSES